MKENSSIQLTNKFLNKNLYLVKSLRSPQHCHLTCFLPYKNPIVNYLISQNEFQIQFQLQRPMHFEVVNTISQNCNLTSFPLLKNHR